MAILNINLNLENDYIHLIKDIYKIVVVLLIFQILISFSDMPKNIINTSLSGSLLNDDFMTLILYLIIGICAYYLVAEKILNFNI